MNIRTKLIASTLAVGTIIGGGAAVTMGTAASAAPQVAVENPNQVTLVPRVSLPPRVTVTLNTLPPRTLVPTTKPPTTKPPTTQAPTTTARDPQPPIVVYVDQPVQGTPAFTG